MYCILAHFSFFSKGVYVKVNKDETQTFDDVNDEIGFIKIVAESEMQSSTSSVLVFAFGIYE